MMRRVVSSLVAAVLVPVVALAQSPVRGPQRNAPAAPVRFVLAPAGNQVRFIVREKLLANTIENDAIGVTTAITGAIEPTRAGRSIPRPQDLRCSSTH